LKIAAGLRMVIPMIRSLPMRRSLAIAALLALSAGTAFANTPRIRAEDRVYAYDAQVAACEDAGVIGRIQSRFGFREAEFWNSSLQIVTVDRIRTTHFRPNGQDLIPRRYCQARVITSDGKHRALYYNIVEDAGITGWHGSLFLGLVRFPTPGSYNVEWCVDGLDRHRTYAQNCRMARP
jgi:NADH:ubiquinone oxidoreductase subunit